MPLIPVASGAVSYAVLIPSKGRPGAWAKALAKMPWLNHHDTYLGVEPQERDDYQEAAHFTGVVLNVVNPLGSVAVARERLRQHTTGRYDYFIVTDDNATHKSPDVLHNLVRAAAESKIKPVVMAGYHNTAAHFDRGKIGKAKVRNGLRVYPGVAMILQCYPDTLYSRYVYPEQSFGLDDRHFSLWALQQGAHFRVCMDAPFTKSRYQEGGQGPVETRARKTGLAIAKLATDFPEYVGAVGTLRIPWQFLLDARTNGGMSANRLVGGSMRKESTLNTKPVTIKRRKKFVCITPH